MDHKLIRRIEVLRALGHTKRVSRDSWSHDFESEVIFNAWSHIWTRDESGKLLSYPLRTAGDHYNLAYADESHAHKRWKAHVDLVVKGKRTARAILPVRNNSQIRNGASKGWLPLVVDGHVTTSPEGEVWLYCDHVSELKGSVDNSREAEIVKGAALMEGALRMVMGSEFERNPKARAICIEHYGAECFICNFSFEDTYGPVGRGFIHVHHLVPLSTMRTEYQVDPIRDLRPVCPNCHAMLHRENPPLTPEEVQDLLRSNDG